MSDIALSPRKPARLFSRPWIFGPRTDLLVSIGGMFAGFTLLFMFTALGLNVLLVWFVWVVTLDTPHFFASYFRTYLDKEERRTSRRLLLGTLSVFLVGPVVLTLCAALYGMDVAQFRFPWVLLSTVVGVWAYLHVTRQHYGILRLYNRKGGELGSAEARLDSTVLYGCLGLAFLGVLLTNPQGRRRIGLGPLSPIPDTLWTSPLQTFISLPADQIVFVSIILAVALLATWYVAFQVGKYIRHEPINLPKVIFLATVILLHSFVAFSGLSRIYRYSHDLS